MGKNNTCIAFTVFVLSLLTGSLHGQEIKRSTVSSTGTTVQSDDIKISQTVGQGSMHTIISADGVALRQGFQQPFTLRSGVSNREITITIFPNPNNGVFNFATSLGRDENFTYRILDANGKHIQSGSGEGHNLQVIRMPGETSAGTYLMHISTPEGYSGEAKIVVSH